MTFRKLSNASARDVFRYHQSLLADETRTSAYASAIERVVRDRIVLDLGCGTGILSLFAARTGAKHVHAIDEAPVILIAEQIAAANGFADRITFLSGSSYDVALPERAEVLVTETMGNTGLDEGIAGAVIDARQRLLIPDAILIPRAIDIIAAPAAIANRSFWATSPFGFDYSRVGDLAANVFYARVIDRDQLVSAPQTIARVELGDATDPSVKGDAQFTIERDASISGIAIWFRAQLIDDLFVTNEPPNPCPSWKQAWFPLRDALDVTAHESVHVEMHTFDGAEWRWRVRGRAGTREQATIGNFPPLRA